jgi:hypothetical protein
LQKSAESAEATAAEKDRQGHEERDESKVYAAGNPYTHRRNWIKPERAAVRQWKKPSTHLYRYGRR